MGLLEKRIRNTHLGDYIYIHTYRYTHQNANVNPLPIMRAQFLRTFSAFVYRNRLTDKELNPLRWSIKADRHS